MEEDKDGSFTYFPILLFANLVSSISLQSGELNSVKFRRLHNVKTVTSTNFTFLFNVQPNKNHLENCLSVTFATFFYFPVQTRC
jgi:hypothetical protein